MGIGNRSCEKLRIGKSMGRYAQWVGVCDEVGSRGIRWSVDGTIAIGADAREEIDSRGWMT